MSLKYRIAATIFLLEAVLLVVVLSYTFSSNWRLNIDRLDKEEASILELLAEFGRTALLTSDFAGIQAQLERSTDDHILQIVLLDDQKHIVASSDPALKTHVHGPQNSTQQYSYWKTLKLSNAAGAFGALSIQFSQAKLMALHQQVIQRSIFLGLGGMLVISIVAITAGHLLTRRLQSVTNAAQRFAAGEKSNVKINMPGNDEIARLARTFDQMVDDRLKSEANLESQVRQRTAELEFSNKELEAFSYSVSHDLRAPLRSIDGFSHMLLEDAGDQLDDESKQHLERIRSASQNMGQLIDDLLMLSRVGQHEVKLSKVDISMQASKIMQSLQALSPNRKMNVSIEPGIVLQGDEVLMRVVLENLIGNAWKYTSKTEEGSIEIGRVEGDTVFIRDNGAGFDDKYIDQIFKPFHRLHKSEEFSGTGIGLATVSRVIGKLGGKVWAEGKVNHGATFYFKL